MQRTFIAVKHDQFGWIKSRELSAKFTSDTAAGSGNKNFAIYEVIRNLLQICLDTSTAQQVFFCEVSNVALIKWSFKKIL